MQSKQGLYVGNVVHKRLRPLEHALSYRVFAVLLDCDALESWDARLRWFSYNARNLFSIYDRDHGDGKTPLPAYLSSLAANVTTVKPVTKFMMLCYPRVLGYGFNPITVYFGLDRDEDVTLMIYEVNNTFGGRKTYVMPVEARDVSTISQACKKQFYVSPFNAVEGDYRFAVLPRAGALTVGVALQTGLGATLKAHFNGARAELTDQNLLKQLVATGWLTVKVMGAIHIEALKLWLKGLRVQPRPDNPKDPIAYPDLRPLRKKT